MRSAPKQFNRVAVGPAILAFAAGMASAQSASPDTTLWYRAPATNWNEALPVGNGRLGAMIFGGVHTERLQLNEDSLWSGAPRDTVNVEAMSEIGNVRRLLFAGKPREAIELADETMMARPRRLLPYQTLGDLWLVAQRQTLATAPASDQLRTSLDAVARGVSPPPVDLEAERREHVLMYQLLGDPLLRPAYPRESRVAAQAGPAAASTR